MFIDIRVSPAFYEPINQDPDREAMRHQVLNIHKNGTAPLEHIFNQMKCAGLTMLGLHPIDYTSVIGCPVVANEEIRTLADLAPDRFIGFASVDACMEPLYEICERFQKPVMFHAGLSWEPGAQTKYCVPLAFEPVAVKHPKLKLCLGQFGWPYVRETAMLMVKYENVYADTGALYFDNAGEFYTQTFTKDIPLTWIDRSLRHQVMFASGNPRFEQIRMAEAIQTLGFRDSTLELICGKNALEFLGGLA